MGADRRVLLLVIANREAVGWLGGLSGIGRNGLAPRLRLPSAGNRFYPTAEAVEWSEKE